MRRGFGLGVLGEMWNREMRAEGPDVWMRGWRGWKARPVMADCMEISHLSLDARDQDCTG